MTIYCAFIRHGDYQQRQSVPSALQPFPLSKKGMQQAKQCGGEVLILAEALGCKLYPSIYSSTALRAWQTAQIIAEKTSSADAQISVQQSDALCERSVGAVANLTIAEIEQVLEQDPRFQSPPPNWKSNSDYCLPFTGAESLSQSGIRVATYVKQTLARIHQGNNWLVLFVGHGASIRHAAYQLGIMAKDEIAKSSMHHAKPIVFKWLDAQFTHVAGAWKQRALNSKFSD